MPSATSDLLLLLRLLRLLQLCCSLMLEKMNKVLAVDKEKQQLRVQGQMTMKDFYAAADEAGLSVPRFGLPWWQGLTLGGVFSTASHGSGNNVTHMIVSSWGLCPI
jgi:FAD/FMN-containing dehydrogenase